MSKEIDLEDGTKQVVYTQDEIDARDKEIADLKKKDEERGENFSQFNKKTEELTGKLTAVEQALADKIAKEKESAKTNTGARYHGNNEEIKGKLEANYNILSGMPESTPEEIAARMEAAARLSGISVESQGNPLHTPIDGMPPGPKKPEAAADEFLKSEKGIAAQKAMGFEDSEITPPKA